MMRRRFIAGVLLIGTLCGSGCRKSLCYDHGRIGTTASVALRPDWELVWERDYGMGWEANWRDEFGRDYRELHPPRPEGLAAFVYDASGRGTERHLPDEGGDLPLAPGRCSLLLYNDDSEYILLDGMESWQTASASTRPRTRATYAATHSGERTVNAPDMLFGAMVRRVETAPDGSKRELAVVLRPLVYTYLVRYEFDRGLEHVALARGALSGMAGSVRMHDGRTDDAPATVLYDCRATDFGIEATVLSFGVPGFVDGHYSGRRSAGGYGLNLEVKMRNGKLKSFDFDVTEQLASQPRGGVVTVTGLSIDDDEAGSDGDFDVGVDGWGDYEDIEVPLG